MNHKSLFNKDGAHYNIYEIYSDNGMNLLRRIFPDGIANDMNFVLFSTSGIHGSCVSLEDIESSLIKYGDKTYNDFADPPDDFYNSYLTILIIHPRLVCMKYGDIKISLQDIPYLKKLRETSIDAVQAINREA